MQERSQNLGGKVAVVTGASSGIGEAVADNLATRGVRLALGARRGERLEAVRARLASRGAEARAYALDVTDPKSTDRFVSAVLKDFGAVDILINSAGLARGFTPVLEDDERDWHEMLEANVMGLMRVTRAFLPSLLERPCADLVHIGSVAGLQPYARGAAYCASKAAVEAFAQALRLELVGTSVREFVIEPGMVMDTEFSEVRFHGDKARAAQVYAGVMPLSAADVADCIAFALTRPAHVSVQTLLLMPTAQAAATVVARKS
jgi:3-hydroxy acid dehydrogenase / malonic semialdehyde reductase